MPHALLSTPTVFPDAQVSKGTRLLCPPRTPQGLAALMTSCWLPNPTSRPTADQAVEAVEELTAMISAGEAALDFDSEVLLEPIQSVQRSFISVSV